MTHTGWREPTPGLLQAEKHAQAGERLSIPKTQAIVAVKKVANAIGLNASDLQMLDTLAAVTQPQDWEQGRRPIVWSSNAFLEQRTGLSLRAVQRHTRRLIELGVVSMKDSTNGKRHGRRDDNGYITEAYGFDLSPLAARAEEFEALYTELEAERQFCASIRAKITICRRTIRAKIEKALENRLRGPWREFQDEFALMLQKLPKPNTASSMLLDIMEWFKAFEERITEAFRDAFEWPEESDKQSEAETSPPSEQTSAEIVPFSSNMTPTDDMDDTRLLTTKQLHPVTSNRFRMKARGDHVPESEPSVEADRSDDVDLEINWSTHGNNRGSQVDIPMLMVACPHFAEMARMLESGYFRNWNDLHRAAAQIRGIAGISEDAWNVANKVLGPAMAAAAVAIIFDKHSDGEVKSSGGYLRAMVERAQAGELHLDRTIFGRLSGAGGVH